MEIEFCVDCKEPREVVIDHRSGDTVCTDCGLVLGDHCVDVTPEWRKLHDQNPGEDRTRVGASSDPLLDNGVLTTCISKVRKQKKKKDNVDGIAPPNNRLNNAVSKPQKSLTKATKYLESMAREVVIDHQSGDTVCTDCGLVLGDHCVDVTPEWPKLHDQNPGEDRTQVGASSDPLLDNGVLPTCISKVREQKKKKDNVDGIAPPNNRLNNAVSKPQKSLTKATKYLESMAREVVIDLQSGDTVCTDCGLILGDHCVDVTPEWRKLHDQNPGEDRTRMGASSDPLLDNGALTTCISKDRKQKKNKDNVDGIAPPNNRLNNAVLKPQKSLTKATKYLESMACWLDKDGLPEQVLYDAKLLYKKAVDKKICRRTKFEVMVAACLFLACQENNNSRTPKEIAEAANGPSRKKINKMVKVLEKELEIGVTV